jgi:hypothetical protein
MYHMAVRQGEGNADDMAVPGPRATVVDRAVRLFRFLARSQQLKSNPPRTTDSYDSVLWFDQLPDHQAIRSAHRAGEVDPGPFQVLTGYRDVDLSRRQWLDQRCIDALRTRATRGWGS